jgi:hypothetical protein
MEVIPLLVPQRDYAVTLSAADLNALSPGEVGLVSLSEAELYIEVSDQLEVFEVESPRKSGPSATSYVTFHFVHQNRKAGVQANVQNYSISISPAHLALLIDLWISANFLFPHGITDPSIIRLALDHLISRGKLGILREFLARSGLIQRDETCNALSCVSS